MELHIKNEFDSVFLINGELIERAECLSADEYDLIYVTVLPLSTTLLPYTVKLSLSANVSDELYNGIRLDERHYLLTLQPRYMTVYAGTHPDVLTTSPISRLFSFVKSGDLAAAYAMLSPSLQSTLGKGDMGDFFLGYERICECTWEKHDEPRFYLIDKNGAAKLHSYTLKDGFIENIVEL